jgi:hypothetical protein
MPSHEHEVAAGDLWRPDHRRQDTRGTTKRSGKHSSNYDPDISRVVNALFPYGQKYVDQLATGYLALNGKEYLPMIVQKIHCERRCCASPFRAAARRLGRPVG